MATWCWRFFSASVLKDGEKWLLDAGFFSFCQCVKLKDGEKWLLDTGLFSTSVLKDGEKWLIDAGLFFCQCVKGWWEMVTWCRIIIFSGQFVKGWWEMASWIWGWLWCKPPWHRWKEKLFRPVYSIASVLLPWMKPLYMKSDEDRSVNFKRISSGDLWLLAFSTEITISQIF